MWQIEKRQTCLQVSMYARHVWASFAVFILLAWQPLIDSGVKGHKVMLRIVNDIEVRLWDDSQI